MKRAIWLVCLVLTFVSQIADVQELEIATQKELSDYVMYYYMNPAPGRAEKALSYVLKNSDNNDFLENAYFFAKIAESYPGILPVYYEAFARETQENRRFLLLVFEICNVESVAEYLGRVRDLAEFSSNRDDIEATIRRKSSTIYDPLTLEIQTANDLDVLWTHFFIYGTENAIKKILDMLNSPDTIKERILAKLASSDKNEVRKFSALINKQLNSFFIKIEPKTSRIVTLDNKENDYVSDLDILLFLMIGKNNEERNASFRSIIEALNISRTELLYIGAKASALWSVSANYRQHERVRDICKKLYPDMTKKVQSLLNAYVLPQER